MPDAVALRVSVVVYRPDLGMLEETLQSLVASASRARANGALGSMTLDIVDNGSDETALDRCVSRVPGLREAMTVNTARGHGNVGYGCGHNRSILDGTEPVHLVLNPDVILAPSAIEEAIRHLAAHPKVVLVTPSVRGSDGVRQFLCRRYPSVLVLLLRGFAPRAIAERFRHLLHRYEMRDTLAAEENAPVPIVSGCCMFVRGEPLRSIGGFSPAFFLYFEDYDLSLRLAGIGRLEFVPGVRIVHHGGNAARKGRKHVWLFLRSARTFFSLHGWRWL